MLSDAAIVEVHTYSGHVGSLLFSQALVTFALFSSPALADSNRNYHILLLLFLQQLLQSSQLRAAVCLKVPVLKVNKED